MCLLTAATIRCHPTEQAFWEYAATFWQRKEEERMEALVSLVIRESEYQREGVWVATTK